jgi:hypothetical protein
LFFFYFCILLFTFRLSSRVMMNEVEVSFSPENLLYL